MLGWELWLLHVLCVPFTYVLSLHLFLVKLPCWGTVPYIHFSMTRKNHPLIMFMVCHSGKQFGLNKITHILSNCWSKIILNLSSSLCKMRELVRPTISTNWSDREKYYDLLFGKICLKCPHRQVSHIISAGHIVNYSILEKRFRNLNQSWQTSLGSLVIDREREYGYLDVLYHFLNSIYNRGPSLKTDHTFGNVNTHRSLLSMGQEEEGIFLVLFYHSQEIKAQEEHETLSMKVPSCYITP